VYGSILVETAKPCNFRSLSKDSISSLVREGAWVYPNYTPTNNQSVKRVYFISPNPKTQNRERFEAYMLIEAVQNRLKIAFSVALSRTALAILEDMNPNTSPYQIGYEEKIPRI